MMTTRPALRRCAHVALFVAQGITFGIAISAICLFITLVLSPAN